MSGMDKMGAALAKASEASAHRALAKKWGKFVRHKLANK